MLPELPTSKKQDFAELGFGSWLELIAPAKTPPDVVAGLNANSRKSVRAAEVKSMLVKPAVRVTGTSSDKLVSIDNADSPKWGMAVAATSLKTD